MLDSGNLFANTESSDASLSFFAAGSNEIGTPRPYVAAPLARKSSMAKKCAKSDENLVVQHDLAFAASSSLPPNTVTTQKAGSGRPSKKQNNLPLAVKENAATKCEIRAVRLYITEIEALSVTEYPHKIDYWLEWNSPVIFVSA